ncbi:MAG: FtsX-like permease family protein [Thiovulaceae bacterium]|nr:FtsX-like permease family protein [Sulfurimonadaceae bacterium]MCW9025859.1 FtsX-like permease family protein [Sulfurimonadaceae bacterium]
MNKYINLYLLEYSINSLLRQKYKNIFITTILTFLIFILSSMFFITSSIKNELQFSVESLPEITVQKLISGKHYDIEVDRVNEILSITGVNDATARVWGYYYFVNAGVNFTLVGIEQFEKQYKDSLQNLVDSSKGFDESNAYIGQGVKEIMRKNYFKEYFNFILPDGSLKKINIGGTFKSDTNLESNDVIVLSKENMRSIYGMSEEYATDIVVKVANPDEVATVAAKIKLLYPDTRVITKNDLKVSYQNIFDYKSGVFLALFIVSLFTFFIIVFDKASGLSSSERKEIGVLKAIGWSLDDVLKEKFYEGALISVFAYLLGVFLALGFVYGFGAPLLRDIFSGYSELKTAFELPFVLDVQTMVLVFFLSVPIYIASIIIPSWRVASMDADEVMR